MSQELTLEHVRTQAAGPGSDEPTFGRGVLRRRFERLVEVAREEHSRLRDLDAERELRARDQYGGE
jgi:hypothetical protein